MREATWYPMILTRAAVLGCGVLLAACGGGGGGGSDGGGGPVTISPATATVPVGGQVPFTLSSSASTTWSVDGLEGGSGTVGTISSVGLYTAPLLLPSLSTAVPPGPLPVTVGASAAANTASVTVVSRFLNDGTVSIGTCSIPSPCLPNSVLAPDLDGDGLSELVTANAATGTISILKRTSGSTFGTPTEDQLGTSATAEPQALVVGTFNGDAILDLVIADADQITPAVWTRLGNGDATFGSPVSVALPATSQPLSAASGRFDIDTNRDVVVANFNTDTLTIFRGDGAGGFLAPSTISLLVGSSPLGVVVADFNNDLFDDIAVANNGTDTVVVFLSTGDGTFGAGEPYTVVGGPSAVTAVDLNTDGCPDLAVTAAIDSTVTFLLNQKESGVCQSTFILSAPPSQTGPRPIALASGDWNKDGLADLVVANHDGKTITIFLGNGNGTLVNSETYPVGNAPQAVAVGDFNNDSFPDLAVANSGDDTVTILRNRGQ